MSVGPPTHKNGQVLPPTNSVHSRLSGTGRIALHGHQSGEPASPYAQTSKPRLGRKSSPGSGVGRTWKDAGHQLGRSASQPQTRGCGLPDSAVGKSDKPGGASLSQELWRPASRQSLASAETDDESCPLVAQVGATLGAVQPNGQTELLHQWCRSTPQQTDSDSGPRQRTLPLQEGKRQGSEETRPLPQPLPPGGEAKAKAQARANTNTKTKTNPLASRPALRMGTTRLRGVPTPSLEWSALSAQSRAVIKQWVLGKIGGRHCLMQLKHDEAINFLISPLDHSETRLLDLRGGVILQALSGLPPETDDSDLSGWLYHEVFCKSPDRVYDDAFNAVMEDISVHLLERPAELTAEQVNLTLRHLALQVQFAGMQMQTQTQHQSQSQPHLQPGPSGILEEKYPASRAGAGAEAATRPKCSDEYIRVQVWLELARLQAERELEGARGLGLGPGLGPDLGPGLGSSAAVFKRAKSRSRSYGLPADPSQNGGQHVLPGLGRGPRLQMQQEVWSDEHMRLHMGRPESELKAETRLMSPEALRLQNASIEAYLMRLVQQREKLKCLSQLAEQSVSYMVLGLTGPEATEAEVKKAYRSLARREHPDKAGTGNKERFQEIQQAYSSLLSRQQSSPSLDRDLKRENWAGPRHPWQLSITTGKAVESTDRARVAAARLTASAHLSLSSASRGVQQPQKKRSLCQLLRLTRRGAAQLRDSAGHLRLICESVRLVGESAETAFREHGSWAETATAGAGLRQRALVAAQSGQACLSTAEYIEKIGDSDETMLRRLEAAAQQRDVAHSALAEGARILSEGLARTAAIARCAADEAMACVSTAIELSCSLLSLDRTRALEEPRQTARATDSSASTPTNRAENTSGLPTEETSSCEADSQQPGNGTMQESAASLRVRNIMCLDGLNEEVLALQRSLRNRIQQREKTLVPLVEPSYKDNIFELVTQLLQSAITEASYLLSNTALAPTEVLEQAFSFLTALEHTLEVAVPVDVKTQTLKLAALLDVDLLCRVVSGPFCQRLLAVAGGGCGQSKHGWANSVQKLCEHATAGLRLSCTGASFEV